MPPISQNGLQQGLSPGTDVSIHVYLLLAAVSDRAPAVPVLLLTLGLGVVTPSLMAKDSQQSGSGSPNPTTADACTPAETFTLVPTQCDETVTSIATAATLCRHYKYKQ